MAPPRVFVSSTYYDLKHLRSSLENFVESLGYVPILSEKGHIAYAPDRALDESCYREVRNSDIFVIVIGGRYGSEKSDGKTKLPKSFFETYDSITRQEYRTALESDIPTYILIEKAVYADYETYLRNKTNTSIAYAHTDSVNIFRLIEDILAQPQNNAMFQFDRYSDIEMWLREQWAGLYRELLSRMSGQQQLATLAAQVADLAVINQTLKNYLEQVMTKVAPIESKQLIAQESQRLSDARLASVVEKTALGRYLISQYGVTADHIVTALQSTVSRAEFFRQLKAFNPNADLDYFVTADHPTLSHDFSLMRESIGLTPVERGDDAPSDAALTIPSSRKRSRARSK